MPNIIFASGDYWAHSYDLMYPYMIDTAELYCDILKIKKKTNRVSEKITNKRMNLLHSILSHKSSKPGIVGTVQETKQHQSSCTNFSKPIHNLIHSLIKWLTIKCPSVWLQVFFHLRNVLQTPNLFPQSCLFNAIDRVQRIFIILINKCFT